MTELKRVFLAINLPNEVKEGLFGAFGKKIPKNSCKAVEMENLHITMRFFGSVSIEMIEEIGKKLQSLKELPKFNATIGGFGTFHNRVFWIGISNGSDKLIELDKKISELLETGGEKFHPHITVARNKNLGKFEAEKLLNELKKEKFSETIEIKSIDLMESKLESAGAIYSKVFSMEFK